MCCARAVLPLCVDDTGSVAPIVESVRLQSLSLVGEDLRATFKAKQFVLPPVARVCSASAQIRMSYADKTVSLKPWLLGLE